MKGAWFKETAEPHFLLKGKLVDTDVEIFHGCLNLSKISRKFRVFLEICYIIHIGTTSYLHDIYIFLTSINPENFDEE